MANTPARFRAFVRAALATFREQGPRVFAEKTAAGLGLRRLLLLRAEVAAMPRSSAPRLPLELRMLVPSELDLLMASQPEIERAQARCDLAAGRLCVVALHEGQVAGSTWIARDQISSNWGKVHRELAQDEAYIFAAHTACAFRGRGVNNALNNHVAELLDHAGVRCAYRLVLPWNAPALASYRKAGFITCGQFISAVAGGWSRTHFLPAEQPC